jgi:hypothetical protein
VLTFQMNILLPSAWWLNLVQRPPEPVSFTWRWKQYVPVKLQKKTSPLCVTTQQTTVVCTIATVKIWYTWRFHVAWCCRPSKSQSPVGLSCRKKYLEQVAALGFGHSEQERCKSKHPS